MSDVLVDSSVWIDFFRGDREAVGRLDTLLEEGRVAVCGPVVAEVTSGARTAPTFQLLDEKLGSLTLLDEPAEVWRSVAEARFALTRQGIQAHLIDLLIAVTASAAGHLLLTRDRDFSAIAQVVPVETESF